MLLAAILAGCAPFGGGPGRGGSGDARCGGPAEGREMGGAAAHGGAAMGRNYLLDETQQQLAEAQEKLKLRPDQQAAWDDYAEKVGALMADQMRTPPSPEAKAGALQQIGRKVDVVRDRLAAMEDIADAAKRLYSELDAVQRDQADLWLPATVPELYSNLWQGATPAGSDRRGAGRRGGRSGRGFPGGSSD